MRCPNRAILAISTAFASILACTHHGVLAQDQQWQVSQTSAAAPPAALVQGTGAIVAMGLVCNGTQPGLVITLARPFRARQVPVTLAVGQQTFSLNFDIDPNDPTFLAALVDNPALVDALAAGPGVDVSITGTRIGAVSLSGSDAALRQALSGCWQPSVSAVAMPADEPLPVVAPADRTAIMRAAGFVRNGSGWTTCEGDEAGDIEAFRDLNGDGNPEALVVGYGTGCHGMTGQGFTLLARQSGAWRVLAQSSGIAEFYPRPGIAWQDIEIGGPGSDCFPFLRWDGRAYANAGTSIGGKICTISVKFEPDNRAALAMSDPASGFGFMGRVPIRLGYYVNDSDRCEAPQTVLWFGRDRHVMMTMFEQFEAIETVIASVKPSEDFGDGAYHLVPAVGEPYGYDIEPIFPGTVRILYPQDYQDMTHCSEEQIPRRFRR